MDGVTKLAIIEQKSGSSKQAENFRKLLLAMSEDIRVLLIKLADRLHNIRTLHFCPEEKRKRIAKETLDIYAPVSYTHLDVYKRQALSPCLSVVWWPEIRH